MPKLLDLFLSLPVSVHEFQFTAWDKLTSRFIWAGARPRIRFKTLQLGLPDLREYYYAVHIRYIVYWC